MFISSSLQEDMLQKISQNKYHMKIVFICHVWPKDKISDDEKHVGG